MDTVDFLLGESRTVRLKISSKINDVFEIQAASYELIKGSDVEDKNDCLIDQTNKIIFLKLTPKTTGNYDLVLTYTIADEILKKKLEVSVI